MFQTDRIESLLSYISDAHKDAYGFRPSNWERYRAMSEDELGAEADRLSAAVEASIEEDREREAIMIERFETRVAETIAAGAEDRATAIRWIAQAEDAERMQDSDDYLEYCLGLPYGYLRKEEA